MLACAAVSKIDSLETPSLQLRIGRLLFALSVVASGIYQLVTGRFVNLVPVNPAHVQPWQAYFLGVLLVLIGVGLLVRRTVSASAITLAALLLVLFFGSACASGSHTPRWDTYGLIL
jgi:uncharacterized membrane protein